MARKLTPRIVTADEVSDILTPSDAPAPRLSRRPSPARLRTRANFADVIFSLWTEAEENFLAIGRYLNHAKTVLEHGEFMAMVDRDLPFRYSTANRLMKVAAAIDDGLLPTDSLPPSYATVYEMVLLNPEEREQAAVQGLFRPDVRRQDIINFKKQLRAVTLPDLAAERAELARLEAERVRIDARIAELREKLQIA